MKKHLIPNYSRRRFIGTAAAGLLGVSIIPSIVSCSTRTSTTQANSSIRLGLVGAGVQTRVLMRNFIINPRVRIVSVCDVYASKANSIKEMIEKIYEANNLKIQVNTYERYHEMFEKEDLDAVAIAVPDFQHATIAIAAINAGLDVYLEKPMTINIYEGQQLVKAVRDNNVVFQLGNMQRTMPEFPHAVKMVQEGKIGTISKIYTGVNANGGPVKYDLPEETLPVDLNWELWKGPVSDEFYYTDAICPLAMSFGQWRKYKGIGTGSTGDWGAHCFDIAQWAIGEDGAGHGPIEIIPDADNKELEFKYANGVSMFSGNDPEGRKNVVFYGDKGWITVGRGVMDASDKSLIIPYEEMIQKKQYSNVPHCNNFLECIETREDPVSTVEIGFSTATTCHLGNIALDLKRSLKWDPVNQKLTNDTDGKATAQFSYDYRPGWTLGGSVPV